METVLVGIDPVAKAQARLSLAMANRHGLIAGATGTGKTVTLQAIAESFSRAGVSVFASDIKGDLSGIGAAGGANARIAAAFAPLGMDVPSWAACPARFWDVFAQAGHPLRATVTDLGPLLLGRVLGLSDVQQAVLSVLFRYADDEGLLVLDLKDLRKLVEHVQTNAKALQPRYGLLSGASLGAITRSLLALEDQGAAHFFGEPALDITDLIARDPNGHGTVNILAADKLVLNGQLYSTFLLWLLSELFEVLPEVGDAEKPVLAFFFDEAHLLFSDTPKALLDKITQTVRLVRSKGVSVWFVTQNPLDIPEDVLGQLGNRVQHALRAFTPKDQKAVKTAAETFRPNPKLDTATVITELGIGEALVSFLDAEGRPTPVERVKIVPPASKVGALSPPERAALMGSSGLGAKYDVPLDRESAYETLAKKADQAAALAELMEMERNSPPGQRLSSLAADSGALSYEDEAYAAAPPVLKKARAPRQSENRDRTGDLLDDIAGSLMKSASRELGRQVVRGLMGGLSGSGRRRR